MNKETFMDEVTKLAIDIYDAIMKGDDPETKDSTVFETMACLICDGLKDMLGDEIADKRVKDTTQSEFVDAFVGLATRGPKEMGWFEQSKE